MFDEASNVCYRRSIVTEQGFEMKPDLRNIDYSAGQKFGFLTTVRVSENKKHGKTLMICKCECGNEVEVYFSSLRSGNTTSCGCKRKKSIAKNLKGKARVLRIGKRFGSLQIVQFVKIEHAHSVYKCVCDCGSTIEVNWSNLQSGGTSSCGCLKYAKVNEDRRMKSLEKEKYFGVHKTKSGFQALISDKYLGHFKSAEEAAKAYDKAAIERDGINAVLNFPDMSEFEE